MLRLLAGRRITRLMVEGGPTVAASLVAADLVDEAAMFRAPTAIGADGIDALEAMPLSALTASPRFAARGIEAVGEDSLATFERTCEARTCEAFGESAQIPGVPGDHDPEPAR
jgi:diaminohydroxyphosphoribosylaminopyrimidine deaminase/5-amino-6-(5-phosphoribosylamino)uracil reductase